MKGKKCARVRRPPHDGEIVLVFPCCTFRSVSYFRLSKRLKYSTRGVWRARGYGERLPALRSARHCAVSRFPHPSASVAAECCNRSANALRSSASALHSISAISASSAALRGRRAQPQRRLRLSSRPPYCQALALLPPCADSIRSNECRRTRRRRARRSLSLAGYPNASTAVRAALIVSSSIASKV